ncbi:MAG TPA: tripartite tricarboxylate transporter substrate-binding protein [Acidobacteriota bacterium]|nr:tripartite tricarboxylate transporter substrate-binding protein [Acidobacteriota bacterium]
MNRSNWPRRSRCAAALLFAVGVLSAGPAWSQSESFYQGKTLRFVVGSATANFYDTWARLIARYWGKYIPGNPNVIVQNMPGAGSISAVNYVYGVAKPDGLTVVLPNNSIYIEQLIGRPEARFDLRKFHWLGSAAQDSIMFYMRADTGIKSVADIVRAKQPPSCGGSGTTSSDYIIAKILELTVGAKINSVSGYQGGSDADLAVEKGEIVCRAHTLASHFGREPFNSWHKRGFDLHLLQSGRKRDARAPEAPTVYEVLEEFKVADVKRRVAQALLSGGEFGRPVLATPGTPPDRVKLLRDGLRNVLKDPDLLAEAKKSRMDVEYTTGEELETLVKDVLNQPAEVIEQARKILGG